MLNDLGQACLAVKQGRTRLGAGGGGSCTVGPALAVGIRVVSIKKTNTKAAASLFGIV